MISLKIKILSIAFFLSLCFSLSSQNVCYYKLTRKVENGISSRNVSGGQFIRFNADVCFECDNKGIDVGHGHLTKNKNYSDSEKTTYMGSSYWGKSTSFIFNADRSVLNVVLDNGDVYIYKRATPPDGVTTCSLIREVKRKTKNNAQLLYEGPWAYGNQNFGFSTLVIYEDYLETDGIIDRHDFVGINENGERIYKGKTGGWPSMWYVSSSLRIRVAENINGTTVMKTIRVVGNNFLNPTPSPTPTPTPPSPGSTPNPIQPHQVTKDCNLCHGSGKCNTCNGKHWYYGIGGTKITCPNCTPNGACSSCGGSGKKTTTEYR